MIAMVITKVKTDALTRGIAAAKVYSKRALPEIINTSAYWIAINWWRDMPFVEMQTVDRELAVESRPVMGKRGKVLKRKKFYVAGMNRAGGKDSLADRIIRARMNPNSRYNKLTHNRYAFEENLRLDSEQRREFMEKAKHKLIASRHRALKFLKAGILPAIRRLKPFVSGKWNAGMALPGAGLSDRYSDTLGGAEPALGATGGVCQAVIANRIGMKGVNGESFNVAVHKHGVGPLQRAIDKEAAGHMHYALRHAIEQTIRTTKGVIDANS